MQAFKMINQISELKINEFLAFTRKSKMDKIMRNEEDKLSIYITVLCMAIFYRNFTFTGFTIELHQH